MWIKKKGQSFQIKTNSITYSQNVNSQLLTNAHHIIQNQFILHSTSYNKNDDGENRKEKRKKPKSSLYLDSVKLSFIAPSLCNDKINFKM